MKTNGSVQPQARLHPGAGRRKAVSHPKGRQVEPAALAEIQALLGDRPRRRDLLIEHLHLIQDHYRQLAARHLAALAHDMRLALAEVYEVATFYAHFDVVLDDSPPPSITVRVCDSLTCAMLGGETLLAALDGQLGRERFRLIGVVRCSPSTLAKRSTVTLVPGLSSAKSRMSPSASTSARSTLFRTALAGFPATRDDLFAYDVLILGDVDLQYLNPGALETMLDISVKYSNERVAFEKKISKFQAVQHNLAKLAGESAAALAAATSAADTFASGTASAEAISIALVSMHRRAGLGETSSSEGSRCDRVYF